MSPVVIIGGGPSHADIDLELLRGHRFIALNSACRMPRPIATAADTLYWHDATWGRQFAHLVRDWPGRRMSRGMVDMPTVVAAMQAHRLHVTCSSGHTAACLAAAQGARRIVLVGFDCRLVDGRSHGHDDYEMSSDRAFGELLLPAWRALAPRFEAMGVDVVNATPDSAIDCFRREPLAETLSLPRC